MTASSIGLPPLRQSYKPEQRESTAEEQQNLQHIQAIMPRMFQMLERGADSLLLNLIEKVFYLHTNLQFHCMPYVCRNLGVRLYIDAQAPKTKGLYELWCEKEEAAINAAVGNRDLTVEEQQLIASIRQAVFQIVYEEQGALQQENLHHPFLSIFNSRGTRNLDYGNDALELGKAKVPQTQEAIARVDGFFKQFLAMEDINYDQLPEREQFVARKSKQAMCNALLKGVNEGSCTFPDKEIFFLSLIASDDKPEYSQSLEATDLAQKNWEYYSTRWEAIFAASYGYSLGDAPADVQEFVATIRGVFFGLIHEEQERHGGCHFVSIVTPSGMMNANYWIELLDAQSKKLKENPFKDSRPRHLAEYTDHDAILIDTTQPGLRAPEGSIIKDFCRDVLVHLDKIARATAPTSLNERLLIIQNQFCQSLAATQYVRGFTCILLKKLNIPFELTDSHLLSMASPRKNIESHPLVQECEIIRQEIQRIQQLPLAEGKIVEPNDAIGLQFSDYPRLIRNMSQELDKLGQILQVFAKTLRDESMPQIIKKQSSGGPYRASRDTESCPPPLSAHEPIRKPIRSFSATPRHLATPSPEIDTSPHLHGMSAQKFEDISRLARTAAAVLEEAADLFYKDTQPQGDGTQPLDGRLQDLTL